MTNEEIIEQITAGGDRQQLLAELWQQNEGITTRICRKYAAADEVDDLKQEAFFALHKSVEGFDPAAGVSFLPYYTMTLKRHLQRYLDSNGKNMVPARVRYRYKQYQEYREEFREEYGRFPVRDEIREETDFTAKELETFETGRYFVESVSLDAPVPGKDGGDDMAASEVIPDDTGIERDAIEHDYQCQLKRELWEAVDSLPDKQPEILRARYLEGLTFEETGMLAGISREQARQQEHKALNALRYGKNHKKLSPFYEQIRSAAMRGCGVERFNSTWTSSTEREALNLW